MVKGMTTTTKEEAPKKEVATAPKARSGWVKWGKRIGTFLMMGGWILVIFLVLGIVILVSVLTSG